VESTTIETAATWRFRTFKRLTSRSWCRLCQIFTYAWKWHGCKLQLHWSEIFVGVLATEDPYNQIFFAPLIKIIIMFYLLLSVLLKQKFYCTHLFQKYLGRFLLNIMILCSRIRIISTAVKISSMKMFAKPWTAQRLWLAT